MNKVWSVGQSLIFLKNNLPSQPEFMGIFRRFLISLSFSTVNAMFIENFDIELTRKSLFHTNFVTELN